jgi:hypothetical protein
LRGRGREGNGRTKGSKVRERIKEPSPTVSRICQLAGVKNYVDFVVAGEDNLCVFFIGLFLFCFILFCKNPKKKMFLLYFHLSK